MENLFNCLCSLLLEPSNRDRLVTAGHPVISAMFGLYSIQYTVYSIQYIVYSIQYTVYSIHARCRAASKKADVPELELPFPDPDTMIVNKAKKIFNFKPLRL